MTNVLIGGDVCPIRRNLPYFIEGDAESLFNDLLIEFRQADLSLVNLECPLLEKNTPIEKTGPILGVKSEAIHGFKRANIDVLVLANNHILDHGLDGLENTLMVCERSNISTVGAGHNLADARKIFLRTINNIKIGILAMAEHEFSIATQDSCGANPLDVIDYVRNIRYNKKKFDYLIVILHGGYENYPYPSPNLKATCRFLVEEGADAVVVQHSHCPGCYEKYQNGYIVYGQGNLIFDCLNKHKSSHEGYLVKLCIDKNLCSTMEVIPYEQSNSAVGARRMAKNDERLFLHSLQERSDRINDDSFLAANWSKFCQARRNFYLSNLLLHNKYLKKLNKYGGVVKLLKYSQSLLMLENLMSCESHHEALLAILKYNKM